MEKKSFWKPGEKAALARAAGLYSQSKLTDILAGRKRCSVTTAQRLEAASLLVLGAGRKVPASSWLRLEPHPALEDRGA